MQVETYEDHELAAITDEEREEFARLTERLGLLKQAAFASDSGINPFRAMTTGEQRVYGTLLPAKTALEEFDAQAIPVRVLKLLEHCKQHAWFVKYAVWHNTAAKDPLLVGYASSTYNADPFILARWGDELENFATLRTRAIAARIETETFEKQKALNSVPQDAACYMHGHGW